MSAPADDYAGRLAAAAEAYAAAGLAVFPVRVSIKPDGRKDVRPIADWRNASSSDPATVGRWFGPGGRWRGASVALDAGRSHLVVVDPDGPQGMINWLEVVKQDGLPAIAREGTPGGGQHWFYGADPDCPVGNSTGLLAEHVDVRADGGFVIVAPSRDTRGPYRWLEGEPDWSDLPVVPRALVERLAALKSTHSASRHAPAPEPRSTTYGPVQASPRATTAMTENAEALAEVKQGSRNGSLNDASYRAGQFYAAGELDEAGVAGARGMLLLACEENGLVRDDGPDAFEATFRSGFEAGQRNPVPPSTRRLRSVPTGLATPGDAGGLAVQAGDVEGLAVPAGEAVEPDPVAAHFTGRVPGDVLGELLTDLRGWLDLSDPTHLLAGLAVAVTASVGAERIHDRPWLLVVGASSGGKTTVVDLLEPVTRKRLDDVTVGGLLGWRKQGRTAVPTGVLTEVSTGLLTLADLSTVLDGDRTQRAELFAMLRRMHDGSYRRAIAPPGGMPTVGELAWEGSVNLLGCVTGIVDQYSSMDTSGLGARFLYCRLGAERTRPGGVRAARQARAERLGGARALAAELVAGARAQLAEVVISDELADEIERVAAVLCEGRTVVPRAGNGDREIVGIPEVEVPFRVCGQLDAVATALLAMGLDEDETAAVCRRLMTDSMPKPRAAVLTALVEAGDEPVTTAELTRLSGLTYKLVRRTVEDLAAIGTVNDLADHDTRSAEVIDPRQVRTAWCLSEQVRGDVAATLTQSITARRCPKGGKHG